MVAVSTRWRQSADVRMAMESWRWPPRLTLSQWADAYRVIPAGQPEPGPWRTSRFPLLKEPMDACTDPDIHEIVLWGPTRCGKTEILTNFVGYAMAYDPAPTLVLYPVEDSARDFSISKVEPMIRSTPALARRAAIGSRLDMRKGMLHKTFPGMTLEMRGAASPSSVASRTVRYGIGDEIDRFMRDVGGEGSVVDLLRKRCGNYWNYKLILSSTCTIHGESLIEIEYDYSDQRKYLVPCLKCHHPHVMLFENIDFDGEKNPVKARKCARYRCPECRHEHFDRDKTALLAGGKWHKHNPESTVAGFWWNAVYSPWLTFGDLAYEFRKAVDDDAAHKVFVNTRKAECWRMKTEAPKADMLAACVDAERAPGDVPRWTVLLTTGVDIQQHVIYFVVRAWGPQGRSARVAHGWFDRVGRSLSELDDLAAATYGGFPISAGFLDSGNDRDPVYDWCLSQRDRRFWPCKGVPAEREYITKPARIGKLPDGRVYPPWFQLWLVNSNTVRATIHDRIPIPAGEPNEWRIDNDHDPEYVRHILAKERYQDKRRNMTVVKWKDVRRDDHYLDAEIYAMAAARLPKMAAKLAMGRRPQTGRPGATGSWKDRLARH